MSRFVAAACLTALLSSFAAADRVAPRFAQPPPGDAPAAAPAAPADRPAPLVIDRAAVRRALATHRADNLLRFRAYQRAGVFPSNTFRDGALNVWRDADGHLCAAATIINASGRQALVARVAATQNFIRLADVTTGPLLDWILTSGLTQAEIAAIQEPFMRVDRPQPVEPTRPIVAKIDPAKRAAENRRLIARYRVVDAMIVRQQAASLDAATDRVIRERPVLAASLTREGRGIAAVGYAQTELSRRSNTHVPSRRM